MSIDYSNWTEGEERHATNMEEAREAAFAEVRRTRNLLGAFDESPCAFDHEKLWKDGFDAGVEACAGWVSREDYAEALKVIEHYADETNYECAGIGHDDHESCAMLQYIPEDESVFNGYDLAAEFLRKVKG